MPLPDISRFSTLDAGEWRALGLRLAAIGLHRECVDPVAEIGAGLPPLLRAPLRRWHLARLTGPQASAMRLLLFDDPISAPEAAELLGEPLLGRLLQAGLLAPLDDGRISSTLALGIAGSLYIFSDDLARGGEAVMGAGETTAHLCRAACPGRRVDRALDLGCGAGTVALVLARSAAFVVATDINPRALLLARINAAINGIENIEFRQGDCFQPLAGESFDLIASQPPFVPHPPSARPATYLYGGRRGDELPLRILQAIPAHLTSRGRAVLMVEWPQIDGESTAQRISTALASATDARRLHLRLPPTDPDFHCGMYAAAEEPALGEAFDRAALAWRDHFAAQGIRALRTVCTVIERNPCAPLWSAEIDVPAESASEIHAGAIDSLIACRDLVSLGRDALLDATLRVPAAAVFSREYKAEGDKPRYFVRLPEGLLSARVELGEDSLLLVSLIHQEPTVRAAVEKFAAQRRMPIEDATAQLLPAVEQALHAGIIAP